MTTRSNTTTTRKNLRAYLRRLSRRRKSSVVTADDAERFLANNGNFSRREAVSHINSIFNTNSNEVVAVGSTPSARPEARGRMITEWTFLAD